MGYIAPRLIIFTLLFTLINYFIGIGLDIIKTKKKRKRLFWAGIFIDVGILAFYKYINFIFENVNFLLDLFPNKPEIPYLSLVIPVGISYYTFQALGYIIRINRGAEKPERNFIKFALFLTFFPKFLSGPVERSNHFFPQLARDIHFDKDNINAGARLFLWGLFKKVVIGNNLVAPVMLVYEDVHQYSGIPLLTILFIQTIHLYCDFSGYTDMALGSARIFGIKLIDNFNRPFFARNVGEFWRRWHISLSSWCNDFIFSPFIVKYRKMGQKAAIIGIFLTFFVIGIWHGANWTFVVLGILQAIAISYEFYTKRKRLQIASRLPGRFVTFTSRIITFIFFCFTLVFFNAKSTNDAIYFITHLFSNIEIQITGHKFIYEKFNFIFAMVAFGILFMIEYLQEKGVDLLKHFLRQPRLIRWLGYYLLILMVYYFSSGEDTFVYLQF
jgi:D-alanyl-lipoteichoic acid acyltransferase DltB (MBOAT superfamily)